MTALSETYFKGETMTTAIETKPYAQKSSSVYTPDKALTWAAGIRDTYSDHFRSFTTWAERTGNSFDLEGIREYFADLKTSGYSASTQSVKRAALKKRARQWLTASGADPAARARLEAELAELDRFGETRSPSKASRAVGSHKIITAGEREILLAAASYRLGLIMELLWATGLRVSEALGIRLANCSRSGDRVRITVIGKFAKERTVVIASSLFDKIRAEYRGEELLLETSSGRPLSRSYVSNRIGKISEKYLGRRLGAHCYRHSFATRKIRETANLKGVSQYLGHASTSITADLYDHNLLSDAELLEKEII